MSAFELGQLIRDRNLRIVERFVAEVQRKDLAPAGTGRSLLVDHIPTFLDEIGRELSLVQSIRTSHDAVDTSETARQHGEQRWSLGYDIEGLVREYGVLRRCILDVAKEAGVTLTIDEFDVLAKCLSVGVAGAATEYVKFRDSELEAERALLAFLAEAGQLLSSSLDTRSTLSRLTGLIVPRLADWCAIHVEGIGADKMPIAHVDPPKVPLLRAIYERYPPPKDAPFGYRAVARTGEPQLVKEVEPGFFERIAQNEEHLSLLREVAASSWIVVPLRVQGNMFGSITFAYRASGRRYGPKDLVLATELASRAAIALDNARLYELSQKERSIAEAASRAKDEFVAMVSHELKTPLNAILGWARLLRGGELPEAKRAHAIEVIERNAEAQDQLVADLLDVSQVVTGNIRIHPGQVDMGTLVEIAMEGVRPAADAKRIALEAKLDPQGATIRGDADRLRQVVWNLLANAVKFTPKEGSVRVTLRKVDSDVELVVADDGEGITEGFLPHVFERFRQWDSSTTRPHGGLGIGLSIAKHIVELHGGVIDARSPGKGYGSTFTVRLPIAPLTSTTVGISRVAATHREPAPGAMPQGLDGVRVLVVDDDRDARDLLAHVLATCGIEVRLAGSASEAIAEIAAQTPHAVVSDIGMPDGDGYSLIRSIRTLEDEAKRSVPAIALTAFGSNDDRTRALVAGFNLHMTKPVAPSALVRAVAELVGSSRG